ncbi:MAG TPA: nucleotide pyrophosphohydrolase [Bacteroidales bacterium]|nr:nucleotide pyrophosphohydrolase [Bacteroidales bacterium]
MTLTEAQQMVNQWIHEKGVRYFDELTNFTILVEEVGELARIFSRQYGEQSAKSKESSLNLEDEMGDVLWILIALANQTGIDLEKALKASIDKKSNRDSNRHKNNPKLRT